MSHCSKDVDRLKENVVCSDEKISIDIFDMLMKLGIDLEKAQACPELRNLFLRTGLVTASTEKLDEKTAQPV
jgi:hypothetical protein